MRNEGGTVSTAQGRSPVVQRCLVSVMECGTASSGARVEESQTVARGRFRRGRGLVGA